MSGGDSWHIERLRGPAEDVHARPFDAHTPPSVWVVEADRPALILGSAQPETDVDRVAASAAGVPVVRRRSGGGAVLVDPADMVWIDVIVPRGHDLWDDDVGRSGLWLGAAWGRALESAGVHTERHEGPMAPDPLARRVCFVGRAAPELTVSGRKVVGVSQRRTRDGARFQCAALLRWDPSLLVQLLAPVLSEADIEQVWVAGSGMALPPEVVVEAFLASLPG